MESILLEDNAHWVNPKCYDDFISRDALQKALKFLDTKEILAIIGARRVGKSTLAKLMIKELLKTVNAKNIFFINLEKPSFIPYKNDANCLQKIFDEYIKLANPNQGKKIYFFLDEVQIFEHWEIFIKSKYENSNIKFIITGSNSSLLNAEFATLLTGRVLKLRLESFSFREFLNFKKLDFSSKLHIVQNKIPIKRAFDEYLKWGGYYSVISNNDEEIKKDLLKNIADDIILKDIVPRYNIKNSYQIRDMFYYLVSNATNTINYSSLAKKLSIDPKMVKEYILYFEDNFLVSRLPKYHTKFTEQIKSVKKLYLNDNGFLNLSIFSNQNLSAFLENLVFIHLRAKNENITYVKENQEIDFYTNDTLYQISYDINDEKTKTRELNAFSFTKIKSDKKILITYDTNHKENDVKIVDFINLVLA